MVNENKFNVLQEENKRLENFINGIEHSCQKMSETILAQLCKRAIKKMNTLESTLAGSTDEYPHDFNFFDILCIELETKSYGEISPFLQETVETFLMDEYNELPSTEKFILDHSESWALLEDENDKIRKKILTAFTEARFEHLKLKKIENYLSKI